MKKIVFAMIVALMGTMLVNAQPPHRHDMNPEQMVAQRVERLDKALGLTDKQKAEVTKIYTQEMESMDKNRPEKMDKQNPPDEATMKAHRQQMEQRRAATNAQIEALLTPEQATKFAEMKKHDKGRGHGGPKRGPGKAKKEPRQADGCTCTDKGGK